MIDTHRNIREILGEFIGKTVMDVSQHDDPEPAFVQLTFTDSTWVRFPVSEDGFDAHVGDDHRPTRCGVCGGTLVLIRGKHPHEDNREVCPTCLAERMDLIRETCDFGQGQPLAT